MRVQLTFRSGAQVVVDVEKLQVTHDGPAKAISAIQWNDATAGNRLLGLVPSDVVAVVEIESQPPKAPLDHYYGTDTGARLVEHPAHADLTCGQFEATQREVETG